MHTTLKSISMKLNVFTLNCWGIPFISKNREIRIRAISQYLRSANHNIVCLQEIWSEADYLAIKDNIASNLPYSHYFHSGVLGSGLCIFSKWWIEDVFFHQWPLNGYIHMIHHGDWFGGKGIALCRIRNHNWNINVYCTHLHAEYHTDDIYLAHRVLQAYQAAHFIKLTSATADAVVLAGDLNTEPGQLSFKLITQLASLLDPFYSNKYGGSLKPFSGTVDIPTNSYSSPATTTPQGKRIDHILFNTNPSIKSKVTNFGNPLADRVPGHNFSYSDHNAVATEIELTQCGSSTIAPQTYDEELGNTLNAALHVCIDAKVVIAKRRLVFISFSLFLFLFLSGMLTSWHQTLTYDIVKIFVTGLGFYALIMGTLWTRIEMKGMKAGISALQAMVSSVSKTAE